MIEKIISGGQTGVDRAALDFAIENQISHGGYCPKGRKAEDGIIPRRYQLIETVSPNYRQRTEKNLMESDGTLVLYQEPIIGGTYLTIQLCHEKMKPIHLIDLNRDQTRSILLFEQWIENNHVYILNIAGPRQTKDNTYGRALKTLNQIMESFIGVKKNETE